MRTAVLQDQLSSALTALRGIANNKLPSDILQKVLLSADESYLSLTVTNLDVGYTRRIRATTQRCGGAVLDCVLLAEYIPLLSPEKVDMHLPDGTIAWEPIDRLIMTCGTTLARLPYHAASEFPLSPIDEQPENHQWVAHILPTPQFSAQAKALPKTLTHITFTEGALTLYNADESRRFVFPVDYTGAPLAFILSGDHFANILTHMILADGGAYVWLTSDPVFLHAASEHGHARFALSQIAAPETQAETALSSFTLHNTFAATYPAMIKRIKSGCTFVLHNDRLDIVTGDEDTRAVFVLQTEETHSDGERGFDEYTVVQVHPADQSVSSPRDLNTWTISTKTAKSINAILKACSGRMTGKAYEQYPYTPVTFTLVRIHDDLFLKVNTEYLPVDVADTTLKPAPLVTEPYFHSAFRNLVDLNTFDTLHVIPRKDGVICVPLSHDCGFRLHFLADNRIVVESAVRVDSSRRTEFIGLCPQAGTHLFRAAVGDFLQSQWQDTLMRREGERAKREREAQEKELKARTAHIDAAIADALMKNDASYLALAIEEQADALKLMKKNLAALRRQKWTSYQTPKYESAVERLTPKEEKKSRRKITAGV